MNNLFQVPSTIQSVRTLVDGGNKLDIITRELNPDEMTRLFELRGKEGWFLFKENVIEQEDIKDLPDVRIEKFDKTPGQRLRAILYRLWETTSQTKTADEFYKDYMEKLISSIKEKLS
jgi:hypothetical protein